MCDRFGKPGHLAKDCWANLSKEELAGGKPKGGNRDGQNNGGKGNCKGRGNSRGKGFRGKCNYCEKVGHKEKTGLKKMRMQVKGLVDENPA